MQFKYSLRFHRVLKSMTFSPKKCAANNIEILKKAQGSYYEILLSSRDSSLQDTKVWYLLGHWSCTLTGTTGDTQVWSPQKPTVVCGSSTCLQISCHWLTCLYLIIGQYKLLLSNLDPTVITCIKHE